MMTRVQRQMADELPTILPHIYSKVRDGGEEAQRIWEEIADNASLLIDRRMRRVIDENGWQQSTQEDERLDMPRPPHKNMPEQLAFDMLADRVAALLLTLRGMPESRVFHRQSTEEESAAYRLAKENSRVEILAATRAITAYINESIGAAARR